MLGSAATVAALPAEFNDQTLMSDMMDSQGHIDCCYLGELDWRDMGPASRHDGPLTVNRGEAMVLTITPTVERCTSGERDLGLLDRRHRSRHPSIDLYPVLI